jgi:hypothetical protein
MARRDHFVAGPPDQMGMDRSESDSGLGGAALESRLVPDETQQTEVVDGRSRASLMPGGDEPAVEQPGKLLRIAVMVRELLEEVRRAPVDEHARETLRRIHTRVVEELKGGLSGPLREELERVTMPLDGAGVPSESEIRIAQAQLLGWLEGLFQGIQAAIATQQMAAAAQLEEMRRRGALPPGPPGSPGAPGQPPGQYL